MEMIKAEISANYDDRDINGNSLEINFSEEDKTFWFNFNLSNKREDDYATVSMKLSELLNAIGKAVMNPIEDE